MNIIKLIFLLFFLVTSCTNQNKKKTSLQEIFLLNSVVNQTQPKLKDLAKNKGITIGTLYNYAYSIPNYEDFEIYNKTIKEEFNLYALEWEFSMNTLWKAPYEYDFNYLNKALKFAQDNGLKVRGTHLVWYVETPDWLKDGGYTNTQVKAMLQAYITALFHHINSNYPNVLTEISVVNEAMSDSKTSGTYGYLRDSFWVQKLGTNYIADIFVWTKAAYPNGKLILNEYGIEFKNSFKTSKFLELVQGLKNSNIPIDGVGLQSHLTIDKESLVDEPFDQSQFAQALQSYQNLGIDVYITELDVRINDDQTGKSDAKFERQAEIYKMVFESCLKYSSVKSITMWGLNDDLSYLNGKAYWLPQERDWGLIFDGNFKPKPAYYSILNTLR